MLNNQHSLNMAVIRHYWKTQLSCLRHLTWFI